MMPIQARLPSPNVRYTRVLGDTVLIGLLATAVKIAGAVKVIVTARYLGAGDQMDAFLTAFLLPSFAADALAGCLTPGLVPILVRARDASPAAAVRLAQNVLTASVGVMAAVALLLASCGHWLLPALGSSFSPAKLRLAQHLFLMLLFWLPVAGCLAVWRAVLNARRRFSLPAAAPMMTPLLTMVALWWFAPRWGVIALCIGTLAGVVAEMGLLARGVMAGGGRITPAWDGWTPELAVVLRQYVPLATGTLISSACLPVDQAVAGMLGSGAVSTLAYGTRFVAVLLGVTAAPLSTTVLPLLSRMAACADWTGLQRTASKYAAASLAFTIPAAVILAIWSEPLVRIVLQKGAFTAEAAHAVARVQQFALVQFPTGVVLSLAFQVAAAASATALLARAALAGFITNVVCDLVFAHWVGVPGIALATSAAQVLSVVVLAILLARRFQTATAAV